MADRSAIEWTDATWNPIRARNLLAKGGIGWHCEKVSDGCRNCYAEPMNRDRFGTGLAYKPGNAGKVDIYLDEDVLRRPLSWRRPRRVFPGSMTDIFGDWVSDQMLDRIFATMILTPQHTYQVLTKRSARMREYVGQWFERLAHNEVPVDHPTGRANFRDLVDWHVLPTVLPNVWLGVSTEDQRSADERVPDLLATPAAIHFVSAEPLLGLIDFRSISTGNYFIDALRGFRYHDVPDGFASPTELCARIDQIISGGESGPRARAMHPRWSMFLRDQAAEAGTAFFHKQNGEYEDCGPAWGPTSGSAADLEGCIFISIEGQAYSVRERAPAGSWALRRVGKKVAGRLLDGVEHNAMPEVR